MLLTVIVNNEVLGVVAPLGAAAYATVPDVSPPGRATQIRIVFAMMREGEMGIDALNRVLNVGSALNWRPTAARPEEQVASAFGPNEYVEYVLVYKQGSWQPATEAIANFMKIMQSAMSMPVTPPEALATTLASVLKGSPKKK